jgi:predicted lipoprotein
MGVRRWMAALPSAPRAHVPSTLSGLKIKGCVMNAIQARAPKAPAAPRRNLLIAAGVGILVLAAIVLDTKVVKIGSSGDVRQEAFSADEFGQKEFPRIQAFVEQHAVDAATFGPAVLADKKAAAQQYGTASSTGAIIPVKLTAVAGTAKSGVYDLKADGVPADIHVRVQTGPAINGTDLRDAPGDIAFGHFKNQIEYQDAGSGINRAMKKAVLDPLDTANLSGKTIEIVGAFRLINPKNWLITPVKVTLK